MTDHIIHDDFVVRIGDHRRLIHHVSGAYARGVDDQEDLRQEIIGHAWRAFPAYDRTRRFSTWLYRIALNVAIDHARAAERRGPPPVSLEVAAHDVADPRADPPDESGRVALLRRLIGGLGELDRALLLMHLDDETHREIGDVLGMSETNVSTRLHRVKQRLRRIIGDREE